METGVASTTLTDFLQHSGRILPRVDEGEIFLRRREGDDLVVLTRHHWEALSDSYVALAEAYHQAREAEPRGGSSPTRFALPWLSLLAPEDQVACLDEVSRAIIAALQSGRLSDLAFLLAQWRATALATWDNEQRRSRAEDQIDHPQALPRP